MEADQLADGYRRRFEPHSEYRDRVWKILAGYFGRFVSPDDSVLDLGCGWGEFINNVIAAEKYGLDLNPDVVGRLADEVTLLAQPADQRWDLDDDTLDVVFTSNFLEHLGDRDAILATLRQAHRCLRPGGRIVCLGPNMNAVHGAYWDYFDHYVPLTERSMAEALELSGFRVDGVTARFLPYTMSGKREAPVAFVRWYLRLPLAWRFFGGQFLVTATKA
ncbi:MAG: class I SAM-dependent methyltransferase [Acidimicrobiia bacterium]|nr:class I SAM-dependent methyltransferase [Acidimicrobiia bacterium]